MTTVTTFRVVELRAPATEDGAPVASPEDSPVLQGWRDVGAEAFVEITGNDDFADPPAAVAASIADRPHERRLAWVAVAGDDDVHLASPAGAPVTSPAGASVTPPADDAVTSPAAVIGYCRLTLPTADNTHLAAVDIVVRPSARGRGVGDALWRAALEQVRAAGRTTVTTWSVHGSEPPEGPDAMTAPTGVGRIRATDPSARFAATRGFALEQTERHSTLHLPVPADRLAAWRADAEAVAGPDYEVVSWVGPTPDTLLDAMAALQQRMSTDVPSAGLDIQEEVWDADRVRDLDAEFAASGATSLVTAARHLPTGELVAFTQLEARPEGVVFQQNTLVRSDHRGRRLGLLVKVANLQLLAREYPDARRIHTWNAGENRHMLAINELIGFEPTSVEGAWQLRLT